ncbi:hypothetical protein GY45DRAFT_1325413 [Cubamyces sp. BRFM 1775]|nr:hypothetical protein GY45DRAFT_1325413 [Cubamyces sp. BRFM 1775]
MSEELENVPLLTLLGALPSALQRGIRTHSLGPYEAHNAIHQALLQIRMQLNLLSPIGQLPPEILIRCFEYLLPYVPPDLYEHHESPYKFPIHPLIGITHVCKRWRDVALSAPTLWTCIDDANVAQLEEFLTRSQDVPINVNIHLKSSSRTALMLSTHGSRMKRLHLAIHPDPYFIPPLLQFEAPLLECLTISSRSESPPLSEDFTMLLFRKRVLNLRALALVGLNPWLPGNRFPHLTHLHLSKFAYQFRVEDNIVHLKRLLLNTPALQYLHIGQFGYAISMTEVGDTIPLRTLRALTFTDSLFLPTLQLFGILDLPRDTMVDLGTLECVSAARSVLQFPVHSRELLSSLTYIEIATHDNNLNLIAQGPRSGLRIQARCLEDEWDAWLAHLTTVLPMPYIEELRVSTDYTAAVVLDLLPQLPTVTRLVVIPGEGVRPAMARALEAALRILYAGLAQVPVLVPQLEVLEIHARTLRANTLAATAFVAMAKARHAHGSPLHTAIVDAGYEDEDAKAELSAAAPYIVKHLDLPDSYIGSSDSVMDEKWQDPEAERWWTLLDV